jgi:N-acetylglucosaminyldiphosphoundecaprenol N-acetyl-beta-D-mannosaminyltransferase
MSTDTVSILGIRVSAAPKEAILEEIENGYFSGQKPARIPGENPPKPLVIVTPNPEQIMAARVDSRLGRILNRADVALPDGIGVVWAARILGPATGTPAISRRVSGVDFMVDLVVLAEKRSVKTALIGGRDGVALNSVECLCHRYPTLDAWGEDGADLGMSGGSLTIGGRPHAAAEYVARLASEIVESGTGLVFVGLGAPKQEYLMEMLAAELTRRRYPRVVLMAVGGSFDLISGRIPRAPGVARRLGLEWLWRLSREPSRVGRQTALPRFVVRVLATKLGIGASPSNGRAADTGSGE